jgi:hypothetical protein
MTMNKNAQELSDLQLDAISGGCYRPEPPKCDPDPCHKSYDSKNYDDHDCYKPRKQHCESPWERWYDKCHDYFDSYK